MSASGIGIEPTPGSIEPAPGSRRAARGNILERLKRETSAEHAAVEAATRVMDPELSLAGYREYLASTFGFYAVVEPLLHEASVWQALELTGAERQKLPLLQRDLRELGVDEPTALPRCPAPPGWSTVAEAAGGAYVLEGSTLGGKLIARHVRQRLDGAPCSFLECYGPRTGESWQAFRAALSRFATSRELEEQIIAGARATFGSFTRWLHGAPATTRAAG